MNHDPIASNRSTATGSLLILNPAAGEFAPNAVHNAGISDPGAGSRQIPPVAKPNSSLTCDVAGESSRRNRASCPACPRLPIHARVPAGLPRNASASTTRKRNGSGSRAIAGAAAARELKSFCNQLIRRLEYQSCLPAAVVNSP